MGVNKQKQSMGRERKRNDKPSNEALFHVLNNEVKRVSETKRVFNRDKGMIGHLGGNQNRAKEIK